MDNFHRISKGKVEPQPNKPVLNRQISSLAAAIHRQSTTEAALNQARSILDESLRWVDEHPEDKQYFEDSERATLDKDVQQAEQAHHLAHNEVLATTERLLDVLLDFSLACSKAAFAGSNTVALKKTLVLADMEQRHVGENFRRLQDALNPGSTRSARASTPEGQGSHRALSRSISPVRSRDKDSANAADVADTDVVMADQQQSRRTSSPRSRQNDVIRRSSPAPAQSLPASPRPAPQPTAVADNNAHATSRSALIPSSTSERIAELHEIIDERCEELRESFAQNLSQQVREQINAIVLKNRERRLARQGRAEGDEESSRAPETRSREARSLTAATGDHQTRPDDRLEPARPPAPRTQSQPPARESQTQDQILASMPPTTSALPDASSSAPSSSLALHAPPSLPQLQGDSSATEVPFISRELRNVLQTVRNELFSHLQELRAHVETTRTTEMKDLNATLEASFGLVSAQFQTVDKNRDEDNSSRDARFTHLEQEIEHFKVALRTAMEERRILHAEIMGLKRDLQARDQMHRSLVTDMQNVIQAINTLASRAGPQQSSSSPPQQTLPRPPASQQQQQQQRAPQPSALAMPRQPQASPTINRPPGPESPMSNHPAQQQPQSPASLNSQQQRNAWVPPAVRPTSSASPTLPSTGQNGQGQSQSVQGTQYRPPLSAPPMQQHRLSPSATQPHVWQAASGHVTQQQQSSPRGPASSMELGTGSAGSPFDVDAIVARIGDAAHGADGGPSGLHNHLSREQMQRLLSAHVNGSSATSNGSTGVSDTDLEKRIRWLVEQQGLQRQAQEQQRRQQKMANQNHHPQSQSNQQQPPTTSSRPQALGVLNAHPQVGQQASLPQQQHLQQAQRSGHANDAHNQLTRPSPSVPMVSEHAGPGQGSQQAPSQPRSDQGARPASPGSTQTLNALVASLELMPPDVREELLSYYSRLASTQDERDATNTLGRYLTALAVQFPPSSSSNAGRDNANHQASGQAAPNGGETSNVTSNTPAAPAPPDVDGARDVNAGNADVVRPDADADDEAEIDDLVSTPPPPTSRATDQRAAPEEEGSQEGDDEADNFVDAGEGTRTAEGNGHRPQGQDRTSANADGGQ